MYSRNIYYRLTRKRHPTFSSTPSPGGWGADGGRGSKYTPPQGGILRPGLLLYGHRKSGQPAMAPAPLYSDFPPVLIECMAWEVNVIIPKDTSAALVKLGLLKEAEHIPQG